ncbi:MAG TPA: LuxR C-terminal-related transcriptional regulator [Acidimicrobiales bacterium]
MSTRAPGRPSQGFARSDSSPALALGLSEAKLRPPPARRGIVQRTVLLRWLVADRDAPVVAVVAPAGYGKTTLLAQWAEHHQPRSGWVSADDRDNDPVVLLTYIATALDRIEPIDPGVFRALASPHAAVTVPPMLAYSIAVMDEPVSLVIDHLEAVTRPECLDAVAHLALALPAGSQLALGSRDALPVPAARLRAQGGLVEVGLDDLAMDGREAPGLLRGAGLDLDPAEIDDLVERTEGWPVGLYLAALALTVGSPHAPRALSFGGDDRFVGDYLRSEILERVSDDEATFLTRTSILEGMSGPLCDATLDTSGSARVLEKLEDRNLLVLPLDHRREWYRYHHLFRDLLASELRRREPQLVPELHRRAAAWCEANGLPEIAIEHAQAAGDADTVCRLVLTVANALWAEGRADTVMRWITWFDDHGLVERYRGIAVLGALMFALAGQPAVTERWAEAAERAEATGRPDGGHAIEATVEYMRALLCRDGVAAMRSDALAALGGVDASSPFRATMLHAEGVSYLLEGDLDRADALLARAADAATAAGIIPFVPPLLAERGIIALERGEWDAATAHADEVAAIMSGGQFDDYWTSALVYAWLARVALHQGNVPRGRDHVARAARLRHLLTYALPVISVQALLEMAQVYATLGDASGGRAVLRQVRDILQQRPDLGRLPRQAEELRLRLDTVRGGAPGASSLTTAELRLLPLLPTHLTYPEIGQRLCISRHTVKTQAISIYRKLGVSTRSEAITRMHELGLLS